MRGYPFIGRLILGVGGVAGVIGELLFGRKLELPDSLYYKLVLIGNTLNSPHLECPLPKNVSEKTIFNYFYNSGAPRITE